MDSFQHIIILLLSCSELHLVYCTWGEWTNWSPCSKTCGIGSKTRSRICDKKGSGAGCWGQRQEEIPCLKKARCSVDGNWGQWTSFTSCSVTCGSGTSQRTRKCDRPRPAYGGLKCEGPSSEVKRCSSGSACPIHGKWGSWNTWSVCSKSCGLGIKRRFRSCNSPVPNFGGKICDGPSEDIIPCLVKDLCPVDGSWSSWGSWGPCDKSCGVGKESRNRTCSKPAPQYGGKPCPGKDVDHATCIIKLCNTESESTSGSGSSTNSGSGAGSGSETTSENGSGSETTSENGSGSETKSENGSGSGSEITSENGSGSGSETRSDKGSGSETGSGSEIDSAKETEKGKDTPIVTVASGHGSSGGGDKDDGSSSGDDVVGGSGDDSDTDHSGDTTTKTHKSKRSAASDAHTKMQRNEFVVIYG